VDPVNLLHELLSALVSLPADLPPDLIKVHLDHSGHFGCVRCRFRVKSALHHPCDCPRQLERQGVEGLATSTNWMAMTLVVRAAGARRDGLVFVAVGVDPDEDCGEARPFVHVTNSGGRWCDVHENWPEGFLRKVLVATIFDEAIDCGCSTIIAQEDCRYTRSDTGEALTDCNVDEICGLT
jgi:hypothetical protein